MIGDGPFKDACEGNTKGRLLRQVVINYILEDDTVTKQTATRAFQGADDYFDSTCSEPLVTIHKNENV